ncbi:hypothetical protein SCP_0108360 [Sparassis crispa]|uniref:Uncharacterized protein n=1 Tax=Sparassis crispa TaxID=139825 RepID=A0A401G714_9APHY|nr:hypothetical protein SCP_0108360 [Sparassis crispa]GBE77954.1 hypothetical protein SCP_0108360 [Sparassis crispa]
MDLLDQPFGPYRDGDILTETCKSVPTGVLELENVMLECGGEPIGLTECEPCQPEYAVSRIRAYGVRFRGVLKVKKLTWLTPWARKVLEDDVRNRDVQSRISSGGVARSTLTLDNIYARRLTIKVVVQGVKNMPAIYLFSKLVPNGLLLTSRDRNRQYEVKTMDVSTYKPSRLHLHRYRTLKVMQQLIKLDKQTNTDDPDGTPVIERTVFWFADLYLKHMAYAASASKQRFVYTSSDSDIEPDTNGQLKEGRQRTLRHLPRAEVLSLLATHAEWILADHSKRKKKYLNQDAWAEWVVDVRRGRREARNADVRWGVMDDAQLPATLTPEGSDADEDDIPAMPRRRGKAKKQKKQTQTPSSRTLSTASGSRSTTHHDVSRYGKNTSINAPNPTTLRTYDSDFSPESTPPASPSSSSASLPSRPSTPPNPEIMALLPIEFMYPPLLPLHFRWVCPAADCRYMINLLDMSDENCKALSDEDVRKMKAGGWVIRDRWVRRCFKTMVSAHYDDHLDQMGIVMWQEKKQWKIGWKKPQHHPPWPPRRELPATSHKGVKIEEEDVSLESSD